MSEREYQGPAGEFDHMPDPTPDKLVDQKAVEAHLGEMEDQAKSERMRIEAELKAGRSAQEILDELSGRLGIEEAKLIIGEYYTDDLGQTVREQKADRLLTEIEKGEK